jgi:hypothetical protein
MVSYSSNSDEILKELESESKYNFLSKVPFNDFMYSLSSYTRSTATLADDYSKAPQSYSFQDSWFNDEMNIDEFQIFLTEKMAKHNALFDILSNETKKQIFLDINLTLFEFLDKDLKKLDENFQMKKCHILLFGFYFCKAVNTTLVDFLFNLFKTEAKLIKSEMFSNFLYGAYLLSSHCMLSTLVKLLGKNDGHLSAIPKEKIQSCTTTCQIKDCKELLRFSEELIFGQDGKKEYSAAEFKNLFLNEDKQNSLAYLLSRPGIRYLLEVHNV